MHRACSNILFDEFTLRTHERLIPERVSTNKKCFNEQIIFRSEIGSPTVTILIVRYRVGGSRSAFSSYRDLIERELHWLLSDL